MTDRECPRCGAYGYGCYECTPATDKDLTPEDLEAVARFFDLVECALDPQGASAAVRVLFAALEAERANCVALLNEADCEYNRKTNALIERHAQQITDLKARAALRGVEGGE